MALLPPALGLSTKLLNKDHYSVYYADMPPPPPSHPHSVLRRHGDEIELVVSHTHLVGTDSDTPTPNTTTDSESETSDHALGPADIPNARSR